ATFIENKFKTFGVKPYFKTYRDNFKVDSLDAFNVVGFIEGNDPKLKDEVIILAAHYDHIGAGKSILKSGGRLTDTDSIANGANDNASSTSAVIALAKYFSSLKKNKRSLMFVLFSAEEKGLLGSQHLAKKLKGQNINLYTMVNFEMIGVPFTDRDYVALVSGYELSNMADKINEYTGSNLVGFSEVAKKYNLFKASDNYAFYTEFGLPCQSISSCDLSNYDYYHHVDDEADKLDYNHMARLINNIIPAIQKMSNTPTKEIVMYEKQAE
ncbi:M28 family peptidase, partial [Desulfosarcina sp.]|nr:M28 family peptidase [Desulfosarcina sp.]